MTHLFRCHSLADIMAEPKNKGEVLSVGAKTACRKIAKEILFGVRGRIDSKAIQKGLRCENDSIALYNRIAGAKHIKNLTRMANEWITGEPDLVLRDSGVDIKTSWSVDTFPLTPEEGEDKTYEWQARGYMMLFDRPRWDIAYCLVDTPQDLIGYEDPAIHKVSHLPPYMRVTTVAYFRDEALEEKIKEKCRAAQAFIQTILDAQRARYALIEDLTGGLAAQPQLKTVADEFVAVD